MTKYFVCFFVLCFFINPTNAQVRFGLKSGLNISNLHGKDVGDLDSRLGFAGGFFISYQTKSIFTIQPEVSYTMKGATTKIGPINITLAYDYIEIPILFKFVFQLKDNPGIKPAIFAGPFIAFKTKAKIYAKLNEDSDEADMKNVTPRDYGIQFGGALGFDIGKYELGFDVRYVPGFFTTDNSIDSFDVKNSVLNFNVYFCFSNMQ